TTPEMGTRRLGVALREAAKKTTDVNVKTEIASAVTLAASALRGRQTSIEDFENRLGLSDNTRGAIRREIKSPVLAHERFQFDSEEFKRQVAYRSVELDNGGLLSAQAGDFDDVFTREVVDERTQRVRFSTSGRVVSERLRKSQS